MLSGLKSAFDTVIDSHPLAKGASAAVGASMTWVSDAAQVIDPIIRGISFYGGAVVVVVTGIACVLDLRRKWKHRNDP